MTPVAGSVPGPTLAEQRKSAGVAQVDLARRLKLHRVTVYDIEHAPAVKPMQAARYQRALRELLAEASS